QLRRGVVVHSQHVNGAGDQPQVPCPHVGGVIAEPEGGQVRIGPEQHRVSEEPVLQGVVRGGRGHVGGAVAGGPRRSVVVGDRDLPCAGRAQRRGRQAVPEQLVVGGGQRPEQQCPARRVGAEPVAHAHDREAVGGIPGQPPALVLQRLRQVPVKQGGDRRDAPGQQRVGQPVIEVQAPLLGR